MLFAAIGLLIGGTDDLVVDVLFILRKGWRRLTVYTRFKPMTTVTMPRPLVSGRLAIFVPAWQEAEVIGDMLRTSLRKWGRGDYRIFVGIYPNDPATIDVVAAVAQDEPRIVLTLTPRPGPTTKADCLNSLWRAMIDHEAVTGEPFKAIVLHDAEDVVHWDSLRVLDKMTDRFDLVQLPVLPLVSQQSRWIAGHYCDEFAEAHGKYLTVREAIGAAVPSAGVGCAFTRSALAKLAVGQRGLPFDATSLTEDYEVGLRIVENGGRGVFVRMYDNRSELVCTREHFPETFPAAVRQKARWMVGISLSGWDRIGWHGGLSERWMRLRDRRAALAALVLFLAYISLLLWGTIDTLAWLSGEAVSAPSPFLQALLWCNVTLMGWRMGMRAIFVANTYGWMQGLLSIPRTIIANAIAIFAARRAVSIYTRLLRGQPLVWDKTRHRFPTGTIRGVRS